MSTLMWVAAVYLAIGLLIGLAVAGMHVQDAFSDLPGLRRRLGLGWPLYFGGCVVVAVIAALCWPYMLVLVTRTVRRVRAEQSRGLDA